MESPADFLKKKFGKTKETKQTNSSVLEFLRRQTVTAPEPEPKPVLCTHLADDVVDVDTGPTTIAYGHAACPHCRSSWIVEHSDGRGGVYLRCWSCRRAIDGPGALLRPECGSGADRRLLPWVQ
jgi:hypothetical protein